MVIGHECARCGGDDHGRPYADAAGVRVQLSVSRASGLVGAAASLDADVGLDLERSDAAGFDDFARVAVHPDENAPVGAIDATRLWVRKEAVLKALGTGLRLDPRTLRLTSPDGAPAVLGWLDPRPVSVVDLRDLDVGDGYAGALAVIGGRGAAYTQVAIRNDRSVSM